MFFIPKNKLMLNIYIKSSIDIKKKTILFFDWKLFRRTIEIDFAAKNFLSVRNNVTRCYK